MTVMPSSSNVADKAVSTEDASCGVEMASIDALLAALVETKVEAMKASSSSIITRRFGSAPASPRRPRLTSSSTVSSSQNYHHHLHHCHADHRHHGDHHHRCDHHDHHDHHHGEHLNHHHRDHEHHQGDYYDSGDHHHHGNRHRGERHHGRRYEKKKRDRHRRHGSAPCGEFIENPRLFDQQGHRSEKGKRRASECPRSPTKKRRHSKSHHVLEEDILDLPLGLDSPFEHLGIDGDQDLGLVNLIRSREAISDICEYPRLHQSACYTSQSEAQLKIHYDEDDDFLALNLEDELDDNETLSNSEKVAESVEQFHRPRKKRKRRRRKVEPEIVVIERELDPDELPARARMTIVATACLLLAMSLLLVGITLRMAPIIDEMGNGRRASVTKRGSGRRTSSANRRDLVRPSRDEIKIPPIELKTPEEIEQARRHRRIAMIVVATFMFLLVASVLAVVVTLTHSSFYIPPLAPKELNKLRDHEMRKENEALMNSLNRDSSVPENSTASP